MSSRIQKPALRGLELPPEFEDLGGVIRNDLKVIVSILADRATERLLLSKRQSQQLRRSLWNSLTDSLNREMAPLTADHR
ncbi:hypothetical protein [Aquisphaera insulae]|uniref:hypothetical protein n=1 Tax=Aquisphaera insulae TaxID=2712864 RepID=UPI0013EA18AD|nr:hypothetical protein [Aquisphaera insulae]